MLRKHLYAWPSHHFRRLAGFITHAFNEVDYERLEQVGAERLCAEWILKNNGRVRLVDRTPSAVPAPPTEDANPSAFFVDYNHLPPESVPIQVQKIDATRASVTAAGFAHLRNCRHIDSIVLHECAQLSGDGLRRLRHVRDSLRFLQISACPGIGDAALLQLGELDGLQQLLCFRMAGVRDMASVRRHLVESLPPNCEIVMEQDKQTSG